MNSFTFVLTSDCEELQMPTTFQKNGMVYDLGYMIYKVFSVVIIRSGERGWILNHICFTKKSFVKIMWIQLRTRV